MYKGLLLKVETRIDCPMKSVQVALNGMYWYKLMPNTKQLETLERFDERHSDWYHVVALPFPYSPRDAVLACWNQVRNV